MSRHDSFRILFERLSTPALVLDGKGRVEDCNAAFERFFGYKRAQLLGQDPEALLAPAEKLDLALEWRRRAMAGREVRQTTRRVARSGTSLELRLHLIPRVVDDRVQGLFAVYHDLGEVRTLEEKLRQAEKMEAIGHLTGGIAHDFNNLLTAIMGYAEMLEISLEHKPEFARNAHEVRKAAEHAGQLTQRLLAFSRKQDLRPEFLHLNSVLLELESMLRRVLGEKFRVETRLDVDLGLVWIDRIQLEQVILNLVVNGRDAMEQTDGGQLSLETRMTELDEEEADAHPACHPGSYVSLLVKDAGCGMDEATRARIFEPFFTTKDPGKGTGLGLASVYGIVTQCGGFIRVDSEPGAGAVFEIALPKTQSPGAELTAEASGQIAFGRETILVVEDDTRVREVTRDYLRMSGYRVLEADGENQALEQLQEHDDPIHLLVTDVVMPDTSGPRLARKLTTMRPGMKVLYQSGYTDNEVLRQGGPEPGWGYLQKPVRQKVITQKVRKLLDGP